MAIKLADVDRGRRNNLNLIRLVLASLVVYSHSYSVLGQPENEPVVRFLHFGGDIGALAVFSFFFISGYLITRSALESDPARFVEARVLRIFPGLVISVLVTVFVFGPFVTALASGEYFRIPDTYRYLMTAALNPRAPIELPGVFASHPLHEVNVPLWTLSTEWTMYMCAMLFALAGKWNRVSARSWMVVVLALLLTMQMMPLPWKYSYKWSMFFLLGAICYSLRGRIRLYPWMSIAAFVLTLACIRFVPPAGKLMLPFTLSYALLCIGFAPQWHAEWFSGRVDLSYGIYIYGWPLQQMLSERVRTPWALFAAAYAAVLACAACSWFGIEKRALSWKRPRRNVGRQEEPAGVAKVLS